MRQSEKAIWDLGPTTALADLTGSSVQSGPSDAEMVGHRDL